MLILNILIFNSPVNDITNKIELICPRIDYSQEIYNKSKNSILLYSKNGFYEPICQVKETRIKKKEKIVNMVLNNNLLTRNTPEVINILYEIINENLKIHCKPQKSLNTITFGSSSRFGSTSNQSSLNFISCLLPVRPPGPRWQEMVLKTIYGPPRIHGKMWRR